MKSMQQLWVFLQRLEMRLQELSAICARMRATQLEEKKYLEDVLAGISEEV
jgi:hypothetical protein